MAELQKTPLQEATVYCMYIHMYVYTYIGPIVGKSVSFCCCSFFAVAAGEGGCFFVVAVGECLLFAVAAGRGGVFPFAVGAPTGRSLTCWFAGASAAEQFVPEGGGGCCLFCCCCGGRGVFVFLLLLPGGCFFALLLLRVGVCFFWLLLRVFFLGGSLTHVRTYLHT